MFFFFQAEDGIRDLVRSRGLGDVYKRQALSPRAAQYGLSQKIPCSDSSAIAAAAAVNTLMAVSYTHLTLPTSDLV